MKPSQAVTERYVTNLLRNGRNKEFEIQQIYQEAAFNDDIVIGVFYIADIHRLTQTTKFTAAGATPTQALRRCLTKHGVTFR